MALQKITYMGIYCRKFLSFTPECQKRHHEMSHPQFSMIFVVFMPTVNPVYNV